MSIRNYNRLINGGGIDIYDVCNQRFLGEIIQSLMGLQWRLTDDFRLIELPVDSRIFGAGLLSFGNCIEKSRIHAGKFVNWRLVHITVITVDFFIFELFVIFLLLFFLLLLICRLSLLIKNPAFEFSIFRSLFIFILKCFLLFWYYDFNVTYLIFARLGFKASLVKAVYFVDLRTHWDSRCNSCNFHLSFFHLVLLQRIEGFLGGLRLIILHTTFKEDVHKEISSKEDRRIGICRHAID